MRPVALNKFSVAAFAFAACFVDGSPLADPGAPQAAEPETRFRKATTEDLVALGRRSVAALGSYSARLTKQERVGGKLLAPQVIDVTVRDRPRALRLSFVSGPKNGRRVLYNAELRASEMLVREAGLLGITSVWVGLDSALSRGDTNHRITDIGFGPLLDLVENDLRKGKAAGGHARKDEGLDASGAFCLLFTAPAGVPGLYADRTRLCIDPVLGLPVKIEVLDKTGTVEKYEWARIKANLPLPASFFTPAAAGL